VTESNLYHKSIEMKALNKQERTSAILKFALWLFICVLIICVPIIISAYMSAEQRSIEAEENKDLLEAATFQQEFISVKIQEVKELLDMKKGGEISNDAFNAALTNIISDLSHEVEEDLTWRGDLYRNIAYTYDFLIDAGKIISTSEDKSAKQINDVNQIMIELDSCLEDLTDLTSERKKKDIYEGLDEIEEQLKKVSKMLQNYKGSL